MKNPIKPLAAMLAVMLFALAGPAQAVDAPKQAFGEGTALAVWVDFEQLDKDMIKRIQDLLGGAGDTPLLGQLGGGLPIGDIGELTDKVSEVRDGFLEAGGEGLLVTLEMPGEGAWSPPMNVLVKASDNADADAMAGIVRKMSEGEQDATMQPVGDGWHNLAITNKDGKPVTIALPEPDKKAFKAFDEQLGEVKKPAMCLAFRLPESMREQFGGAGQNGRAQDPQAAMMMGMMQSLQGLDTLGVAISEDDEELELDIQAVFLKPGQAQQFAQMYNSMMQLAPVLLANELPNIENAPDVNTVTKFFNMLIMKQNGDTLKLNLDKEFFELAEEVAPVFEAMQGRGRGQQL
ncbi:MAG: hypothetical protein ACE37H_15040 [Phycisphaeraceae bacterium]